MNVARHTAALSVQPSALRAMTRADVEAVMAIEVRSYRHPWSAGNFVDSLLAGYECELLQGVDGEVVAYFVAMAGVGELHLLNITVAPEHQGRGLGQQLLKVVQQRAAARGLDSLWLEVRQNNLKARGLYRYLGFEEVGVRKGYYPQGSAREDAVVMRFQGLTA